MTGEEAAKLVEFQLTYGRSCFRREFYQDGLTGPPIPCAFEPERLSDGSWGDNYPPFEEENKDEYNWFQRFFATAVSEAVHEVMEWFKVNDQNVINPHEWGKEQEILDMCTEFGEKLYERFANVSLH